MPFTSENNPGKGRPKGSKNAATIEKERRRELFDEEVAKMFQQMIRKARPEYLIDQYMGKAPESIDLTSDGEKLTVVLNIPRPENE